MTQHRPTLKVIEREGGVIGKVLRPLSARLLDPTIPEVKGWVDRARLGDLSGRSRKGQLEMAQRFNLKDFPRPAGGCCHLIDPCYAGRFKDWLAASGGLVPNQDVVRLLTVGRHFRISPDLKVIVGRDKSESDFLEKYSGDRPRFWAAVAPGAIVVADTHETLTDDQIKTIGSIALRYSDAAKDYPGSVCCRLSGNTAEQSITVNPINDSMLDFWRIG